MLVPSLLTTPADAVRFHGNGVQVSVHCPVNCTCAHAGVSLPIIENITAGTRCINLTWSHNKTCCSNSKNTVSWQQWQSEGTSAHANKNSSRMVDPADHHLSITPLNPGTMYIVTVSVECQSGELQSINRSINTTTGKSTYIYMYALEYLYVCINVQDFILVKVSRFPIYTSLG